MEGLNLYFRIIVISLAICSFHYLNAKEDPVLNPNDLWIVQSINNAEKDTAGLFDLPPFVSLKNQIQPEKIKIGLKVYTNSGPGLSTPTSFVKVLIDFLISEGYRKENIFITDLETSKLRASGFIPPISERSNLFHGVKVMPILQSNQSAAWFYESPLPPNEKMDGYFDLDSIKTFGNAFEEDRISLLNAKLILETDFWINLPMFSDHKTLGINGALLNATLWNITNNDRFFINPNTGHIGIAEIASIPELKSKLIINVGILERLQYIGGPHFNSHYNKYENKLLLSTNPAVLDFYVLSLLNKAKIENGFRPIKTPKYFQFYQTLNPETNLENFSIHKISLQ